MKNINILNIVKVVFKEGNASPQVIIGYLVHECNEDIGVISFVSIENEYNYHYYEDEVVFICKPDILSQCNLVEK